MRDDEMGKTQVYGAGRAPRKLNPQAMTGPEDIANRDAIGIETRGRDYDAMVEKGMTPVQQQHYNEVRRNDIESLRNADEHFWNSIDPETRSYLENLRDLAPPQGTPPNAEPSAGTSHYDGGQHFGWRERAPEPPINRWTHLTQESPEGDVETGNRIPINSDDKPLADWNSPLGGTATPPASDTAPPPRLGGDWADVRIDALKALASPPPGSAAPPTAQPEVVTSPSIDLVSDISPEYAPSTDHLTTALPP